ncbi:hypothetical protein TELCIR_19179 [Teladorsagia circumcincta]|uniref:Integrase catalytic domain-containing protein n=1 Tax=Teladorsagia circumcincta TaxID=45464 RepID=A0A2G9TPY6_TELCI|nr:hypothetical protein TELCIR_19179 [Teladorsagia circumcincta]
MSKSRLAPLNQPITIPRLELAAVTIGAKLLSFLVKQLDVPFARKFLWTDSKVALSWITHNKHLPVFVRNRVQTIEQNTSGVHIRHLPGTINPADLGTRGCSILELMSTREWWKGPAFLIKENEWPEQVEENLSEESEIEQTAFLCTLATASSTNMALTSLVDPYRFSSWRKLVNSVFYVLRFLTMKSPRAKLHFGNNKVALLYKAETILFRIAQATTPPSETHMKQLRLYLCDTTTLWKCRGRIDNASLSAEAINPVFLPPHCRITELFVLHIHQSHNHCGMNHTLTLLRQQVWIPKGRATVKRILHNDCYQCKRYLAKPYSLPPFPVHPERRVRPPRYPFENVGMDFFGPLQYRNNNGTTDKLWMILFTCLNCRAIYVDVLIDMTARTVLHVLRRFIATIGSPTWILCDNAKTFKTINQCYASLSEPNIDNDIIDYCANKRIQMKFIPSLSPWQGGIYEKMIDIFKKSFKRAISNRTLDVDDIKTIAKEAEAIMNSQPLTLKTRKTTSGSTKKVNHETLDENAISPESSGSKEAKPYTECIKGGLLVSSSIAVDIIEACINSYCVYAQGLKRAPIIFPNSFIMYDYTIAIKAYANGKLLHHGNVFCKAHPICETLGCTFCWERIYNTQCWTILETTFIISSVLLSVIIIPWLCYLIKLIGFLFRIPKFLVCRTLATCASHRKSANLRRYTSRRRRSRAKKFLTCVISILSILHLSKGCSEVVSIKTHEETCTVANGTETCAFNEAMVITMKPLQQEICVVLKNHDNQPVGMISLKVNGILFQCRKNVEFFTRDHELTSESVHRCYLAGTCNRNTCENMSPIDKGKEFSTRANTNPGYTFCVPSCGCLRCDGCFLCEKSCLFYRIYAVPTTPTIYTIFTCPSWEVVVSMDVTLRQNDSSASTTIQLHPGQIAAWNNLKFSLVGTIVPHLPILSSTFAEAGTHISVIKPTHRGQLTPHSAGQLQCSTKKHAETFNCTFAINACKCTYGLYKASCTCSPGSVADLMQPTPLPLVSKTFMIFLEDKNLYARTNIGSALQLHLVAENMKITTRQSNSTCTIETSDLTGCYNCIAGAKLTLYCRSSEGEITANINCPSQTQTALCTPKGHINNIKLHFDTSTIFMLCNATCPGGTISISVQGSLLYVNDNLIRHDLQSKADTIDAPAGTTFLSHLSSKFKEIGNKILDLLPTNFLVKTMLSLLLTLFALQYIYHTAISFMSSTFSKKHH